MTAIPRAGKAVLPLPPHPARGDRIGWSIWWATWCAVGRDPRLADGLGDRPPHVGRSALLRLLEGGQQ